MIYIAKEKEVKFKLDEIPANGCLIKEDYVVCKRENGDISIAKVEEPIKKEDIEKWVVAKTKKE